MPKQYRLDRFEMPDIESMEPKLRKKVLREAGKIARDAARQIVPVRSGRLKKSLTYGPARNGYSAKVKPGKFSKSKGGGSKAPHAHLVHDGTKPHQIRASTKEKARSGWRFYHGSMRKAVKHPGARAQKFLVEAGEKARPEIEEGMRIRAEEVLAEVAEGR